MLLIQIWTTSILGDVAFVGVLVAGVVGPDLDDVDLFAGEDHALVGEEADALGVGAVWIRKAWAGELVGGGEVDDDTVGGALEEAAEVADDAEVAAVEPGVAAEGFEHLVEEFAAALLLGFACGVGGGGAGDVAGLGRQGPGGCDEEADREKEREQYWHFKQTGGPSTAPLAMKPRETPLRMTIFIPIALSIPISH